jgi:hypothetical protein
LHVERFDADPAAIHEIHQYYDTRGELARPLVTMHTLLDEVVPYEHEPLYTAKTLPTSWVHRTNLPVARYGHCEFNLVDASLAVAVLLLRSGELQLMYGLEAVLGPAELDAFEQRAAPLGIPYQVGGDSWGVVLSDAPP